MTEINFDEDKRIHAVICRGMEFVARNVEDGFWNVEIYIDNDDGSVCYSFSTRCYDEDDARHTMEEVAAGIRSRMQSTKEKK